MPLVDEVYDYDDTEEVSPLKAYMNLLGASVRTALNTLKGRVTAVEAAVGVSAWTAPALASGWVNYGGTYEVAGYRRVGTEIEVRGFIKSGATAPIFTLPVGSRPGSIVTFIVASAASSAIVSVNPDGSVALAAYGAGGSNANVSLRGIRFEAAA